MVTQSDSVPSQRFLQEVIANRGQAAGLDGRVFRAKGTTRCVRDRARIVPRSSQKHSREAGAGKSLEWKRFVVHADEKLTAFVELEAAICEAQATCISST